MAQEVYEEVVKTVAEKVMDVKNVSDKEANQMFARLEKLKAALEDH